MVSPSNIADPPAVHHHACPKDSHIGHACDWLASTGHIGYSDEVFLGRHYRKMTYCGVLVHGKTAYRSMDTF